MHTFACLATCLLSGAAARPPAGGLQSLPELRSEAVRLANPGFEDGTAGWSSGADGPFQVSRSGARSGTACLRFDASVPSRYTPSVRQALKTIGPGVYRLRFRVKCRDMKPPARGTAGVRVSIEYRLGSGARAWPSTDVLNGTFDWRLVELSVLLPKDMKPSTAFVSIHRYGKPAAGVALFDDVSMERLREPPVEAYLRYPNYRGYLSEDAPQRVRLWVKANEAEAAGPARVEVTNAATGRRIAGAAMSAAGKEEIIELDAGRWPPGRYAIRARLGEHEYPPYVIQKISARQRRGLAVWFDRHHVLHVHGKPVFPIGFYNTVRRFAVVDDAEIARLDKLAEAETNFTINYTWWPCSMKDRRRYLTEMRRRGIAYLDTLMPFQPGKVKLAPQQLAICNELLPAARGRLETQDQCDRFLALLAREMRKLPGHAGWYVMDERPFGMVPAIFHQYTVLRRADCDHPTYGVSNKPGELHKWRDALDVFGLDPYPLLNMKLTRPLSEVGRWTRAGVEATQGSRPVWMVIQFFQGWSTDRWPTEEELRTMSLMAITEGARGLFYWSFGIRALLWVKDPAEREAYWQRAVKVTRELKSLTPALIARDAPEIVSAVSDPRIRWRGRTAGGKWYVFAYLPAASFRERFDAEPLEVTFSLQDGQKVRRSFRPDTADWFAVTPRGR